MELFYAEGKGFIGSTQHRKTLYVSLKCLNELLQWVKRITFLFFIHELFRTRNLLSFYIPYLTVTELNTFHKLNTNYQFDWLVITWFTQLYNYTLWLLTLKRFHLYTPNNDIRNVYQLSPGTTGSISISLMRQVIWYTRKDDDIWFVCGRPLC